jgi:hypothetical protein
MNKIDQFRDNQKRLRDPGFGKTDQNTEGLLRDILQELKKGNSPQPFQEKSYGQTFNLPLNSNPLTINVPFDWNGFNLNLSSGILRIYYSSNSNLQVVPNFKVSPTNGFYTYRSVTRPAGPIVLIVDPASSSVCQGFIEFILKG